MIDLIVVFWITEMDLIGCNADDGTCDILSSASCSGVIRELLCRWRTILLVQVRYVLIVLLVVGALIELGHGGEERTRNLGQGMEEAPVEADRNDVC